MKQSQKIELLRHNHFTEWLKARQLSDKELSEKQKMFCMCGKLATGLHESTCKKFNKAVNKLTLEKLKHLIK